MAPTGPFWAYPPCRASYAGMIRVRFRGTLSTPSRGTPGGDPDQEPMRPRRDAPWLFSDFRWGVSRCPLDTSSGAQPDCVERVFSQLSGKGILLAGVVGCEERELTPHRDLQGVSEAGLRRWNLTLSMSQNSQDLIVGELTQRHDTAESREEEGELAVQEGLALRSLIGPR